MTLKADQLKNYRKSILEFIDYLHDNRSHMKDDVKTIEEIYKIGVKQYRLKPRENYKDMREFNKLQSEKEELYHNLTWNNLIYSKAKELKLYENLTIEIRNNLNPGKHLGDHIKPTEEIKPAEEKKIIEAKEKYLTFRKETDFCNFLNGLLSCDLDLALTEFFGAFTDVSDMKRTQTESPAPQSEDDPVDIITNNFNSDDINSVIDHFQDLEKNMKKGEFMQWIKQAFELQEPPEHKFKLIGKFTKREIRNLFHSYWKNSGKQGDRGEYAILLSDYFEGFPYDTTMNNFNK
ncbi:hypothetical protein [Proteiniphilum sp.]|uniref:hypothetical protein n=1 Tax=Proteiniphilum sp. TaxID=1926877 RepID=UPI003323217C